MFATPVRATFASITAIAKDSAMVKGFELLRNNLDNSVLISAGSTGALVAGSLLKVGRIKGIGRPALASVVGTEGNGTLLLDIGANAECKVNNLAQFAVMGSVYMEKIMGRKNPMVGLLNIGEEETKGNDLFRAAYQHLKQMKGINFAGNIEARNILDGIVDVLVCDGFTGNIALKSMEGIALSIFGILKEEFNKNLFSKLGALLLKPGFQSIKNKMDYAEYGGAPLLGINSGIIKAHGSSKSKAIRNAIYQGKLFIEQDMLNIIRNSINS